MPIIKITGNKFGSHAAIGKLTMEIHCVSCQAAFRLETDRINRNGSMVRCLKCGYIFVVYPPEICGSPVTQETNIDQSILGELLEMQNAPGSFLPIGGSCGGGRNVPVGEKDPMETVGTGDADSDSDDAEYAELPDLSELEKMIDWDDIKDLDDTAGNSRLTLSGSQVLDISGA